MDESREPRERIAFHEAGHTLIGKLMGWKLDVVRAAESEGKTFWKEGPRPHCSFMVV
jgi:hypothetical protein